MSCNKLSVTGPMTLTNAHVHDDATLVGSLTTAMCTFKAITITADKIELKDTQTKNIIVKKNNPGSGFFSWFLDFFGFNSPQERSEVMTLSGNTTITGDLTFESSKGHLIIMPGAHVAGNITGATIERK